MSTAQTARPAALDFPTERPDRFAAGWGELSVEREDITFSTTRPGVLAVEVTVRNTGRRPTPLMPAVLRSAPLGAFVPWKPLGVVVIPSLEPGRSAVVREEVRYTPPAALGGADKIPPHRLLTALGLGEPGRRRPRPGALASDLMALLGRGGAHWAGNLNVFFPGKDVERHTAKALRVYPGRVNLAMFVVGCGGQDAYQFWLTGDAADWGARLYDTLHGRPIAAGADRATELAEGEWQGPSTGLVLLAVEPPAGAEAGAVNVHVRQRSSRREAVVEFTLDPRADGPGCYVV